MPTPNYNAPHTAPPNLKEITEGDFAQSLFFTYDPISIEYRTIPPDDLIKANVKPPTNGGRPCVMTMRLYWFHDKTGVGLVSEYWEKRVRYFSFAECEHDMKHFRNLGNCYNEYQCSKCKYTQAIDSSD